MARRSDFDKLWAGQTVSVLGSAVTTFALPTLAVLVLHATPVQVGVLAALQTLPFPVLGMIVGVLADRLSRRTIMIVADVGRCAALGTVPLAAIAGVLHMWELYAVGLVSGVGSVFFGIAYQSYLPVIVSGEELTSANTKLEFSNSGSSMAGNAMAGALVQTIGAAGAIAVDAFSYLVSVFTLMRIRAAEPLHEGPPLSIRQGLREMWAGLAIVLRSPDLRWIMGATATANFGGAMANAVVLIYAYRVLHLQPAVLGLVFGLAEIGFVGAMLSGRVRERLGLRATLIGSSLLTAIGMGCMLFARLGSPYVVLFATSVVVAVAVPIYNINQVSYRQALVDVRMQGRMNATMRTFAWGTLPAGALTGGYVGAHAGVPATIALAAGVAATAALWLIPLRERIGAEQVSPAA